MSSRPPFDHDKEFHLTQVPHPTWKPGEKQPRKPDEGDNTVTMDPETIGMLATYKLLTGGVAPRPIAFVSTCSKAGHYNLAPFSYFNVFCHDPPTVVIGVSRNGPNGPKDTARNILETGEFVVSIISEWFAEASNYTCIDAPTEQDEFQLSGLTPIPSVKIDAPRVQESAFQMECKLLHHYPLVNRSGQGTSDLIVGEVVLFHINREVVNEENHHILPEKLRPLSRLGGLMYGRSTEAYELTRPVWAEEQSKLERL